KIIVAKNTLCRPSPAAGEYPSVWIQHPKHQELRSPDAAKKTRHHLPGFPTLSRSDCRRKFDVRHESHGLERQHQNALATHRGTYAGWSRICRKENAPSI